MNQQAQAEIAAQAVKVQVVQKNILSLSAGVTPHDYRHPNYRPLQTAIRAFKREDGRLTRLKKYWKGQLALLAEGIINEDGTWND